jgi:hypothetical protein
MFQKTYKFMGMIIVMVVLLGHHSFQAQAMESSHHNEEAISCIGHDCHHPSEMEICEKIQSDEMQVGTEFVLFPEGSQFIFIHETETFIAPDEVYEIYRERIPLSQKQLARSHL